MHATPEPERGQPTRLWSMTTLWMLGLVGCFAVQQVVIVQAGKPYDAYLALSGYGMKSGHLWELFTCQLLHCGPLHLLVNLLGLWFLGRAVEAQLGSKRFVLFCLAASLAGTLLQGAVALCGFLLPESLESAAGLVRERFGGPVLGSSIGPCAILAAFCLMGPERRWFRVGGVPMTATHLWWLSLTLAVLLVVVPTNPDLAHVAHLGALLAGGVMIRFGL